MKKLLTLLIALVFVTGTQVSAQCYLPDTLRVNFFDELPLCNCLIICADQPLTLCFDDLSENERPTAWTITPGCAPDQNPFRIPNEGCDNPECPPAAPQVFEDWNYSPEAGWCLTLISSTAGCYCFCLDDILPVELNNFSAVAGDETVTLTWSTATETSTSSFDIERDGTVITTVPAENSLTGAAYSWTETGLDNGHSYDYSLVAVSVFGVRDYLAIESATPAAGAAQVSEFALHQNYPNPFNPETSITFDLAQSSLVTLTVYNSLGQVVSELAGGTLEVGRHSMAFNGVGLTSGLYFYRLTAGDFSAVRKMMLLK